MKKKILLYLGCGFLLVSLCSFVIGKKISYKQKVNYFKENIGYTPYELMMTYTKAHEGYSETWYKDGKVKNGKISYSIGYGINDHACKDRRHEIRKTYMVGNETNKELASKAVADYFKDKKKRLNESDIFKETASLLHIYNRGSFKHIGRCCGKKSGIGCGSPNRDIKASHTKRRKFEYALWHHNIEYVKCEMNDLKKN